MRDQISVLLTTKLLLERYLASVQKAPNKVEEETEDFAYAIIYLFHRYADEFQPVKWMDILANLSEQIGKIETVYRDMVVFQAPLWCCMFRLDGLEYHVSDVLNYGLSQNSMGRSIYLYYTYLISRVINHKQLKYYVKWYCSEGKICVESLLYIFINSLGNPDEKMEFLDGLCNDENVSRYPQVTEYIKRYLKDECIENPFAFVDQQATNTILDFILFRDLSRTKQLEIDFSII